MNSNLQLAMPKRAIKNITIENMAETLEGNMMSRDREIALRDLVSSGIFIPFKDESGPYDVTLGIEENRLVFRIKNAQQKKLPMLVLSLKPYKRLIKDYFMIVRSYDEAIKGGNPSRIEAIDMGRRGLHNEGADMLMERLDGKIEMDHKTARRLFTLICVLHSGKVRGLR